MTGATTPFWFKQRQCKAEAHNGAQTLKVTGPNLPDAYLSVLAEGGNWRAVLRFEPAGPEVAVALAEYPNEKSAWEAAFELYRTHVIA